MRYKDHKRRIFDKSYKKIPSYFCIIIEDFVNSI